MATQTYEQLIAGANKIKENELPESNTHDLVGEQLLQMTNKMQEESTKTDNSIMEYNVSKFYPTSGLGGTNKYTLETAIALVPEKYRSIGIKCSFIGEDGQGETWEYVGTNWVIANFKPVGTKKISELESSIYAFSVNGLNILFPVRKAGIRTNSGVTDSGVYSYTAPIKLKEGETIHVFAKISTSTAVIGVSDSGGSTFTGKVYGKSPDTVNDHPFTADSDCYVIANGRNEDFHILIDTHSISDVIGQDIYSLIFGNAKNGNLFTKSEYYKPSEDKYVQSPTYLTTDYIEYNEGDMLLFNNGVYSEYVGCVICFNGEKTKIGSLIPKTTLVDSVFSDIFKPEEFPVGTKLIRLTIKASSKNIANFVTSSFSTLISRINTFNEESIEKKIVNKLVGSYPHPSLFSVKSKYISKTDGTEKDNSSYYSTPFIPVTYGECVQVDNCATGSAIASLACYDINESFIGNVEPKTAITDNKYSDVFYYTEFPEGTALVRACSFKNYIDTSNILVYSIQSLTDNIKRLEFILNEVSIKGKTIVCLGDSLTQFKGLDGKGYCDYLIELGAAKVYNCGIGGSQICQRAEITQPLNETNLRAPLDIVNLVSSVSNDDWISVDEAIAKLSEKGEGDKAIPVQALKSVDWDNVDIIIIFAGTNDWGGNMELGNIDSESIYESCGALNSIVSMLSKKSPKATTYYFSPVVRYWNFDTPALNCSRTDENWGDTVVNKKGVTLEQQVDKLVECARKNKIPCCDLYHTLGWNRDNFSAYFQENDNTHPVNGFKAIAKKIIKFLSSN